MKFHRTIVSVSNVSIDHQLDDIKRRFLARWRARVSELSISQKFPSLVSVWRREDHSVEEKLYQKRERISEPSCNYASMILRSAVPPPFSIGSPIQLPLHTRPAKSSQSGAIPSRVVERARPLSPPNRNSNSIRILGICRCPSWAESSSPRSTSGTLRDSSFIFLTRTQSARVSIHARGCTPARWAIDFSETNGHPLYTRNEQRPEHTHTHARARQHSPHCAWVNRDSHLSICDVSLAGSKRGGSLDRGEHFPRRDARWGDGGWFIVTPSYGPIGFPNDRIVT